MNNEELVYLYQNGNNNVLNELIENNRGIIVKLANKFYINNSSIEKEDIEQEGYTGLIIAAQKYDLNNEKRALFITYAVNWIYQRMYKLVVGTSKKEEENNKLNNNCTSLNTPMGEDEDMELIDYIEGIDYSYENIDEKIYIEQLHQDLDQVMKDNLTLKESEILKFSYGWNNISMTLKEIGEMFDISITRAGQIKINSLSKLRTSKWVRMNKQRFISDGYICNHSIIENSSMDNRNSKVGSINKSKVGSANKKNSEFIPMNEALHEKYLKILSRYKNNLI